MGLIINIVLKTLSRTAIFNSVKLKYNSGLGNLKILSGKSWEFYLQILVDTLIHSI